MKTKYQKSVAWLEPFVKAAKGIVPVHKLTQLKGFKVTLDKVEDTDGQTLVDVNKSVTITLRTHNHIYRANDNGTHTAYRHKPCPTEHMLWTLAHELAHLKEWNHTPTHLKVMSQLLRRFSRVLSQLQVSVLDGRGRQQLSRS